MMPNQTQAALARHWALLLALIAEIGGCGLPRFSGAQRNQAFQLVRLAESLARRWLILKARVQGDTGKRRPGTSGGKTSEKTPNKPPKKRQDKSSKPPFRVGRPPARPLFCLVESEPGLRAEDYSLAPIPPACAGAAPREETPVRDVAVGRLKQRVAALQDVVERPAFHTARMALWLRRAAERACTAFVRLHPLRVGRPPGARRRDKTCPYQRGLWWLDRLARDSLLPGWVP